MKGFTFLGFIFLIAVLKAQSLVQYNLYPFNPDFANPAATGLTNCMVLNATDMHQWIGITDAPSVQSFSIQKGKQFAKTKKHGLGANLIRDANGPSKKTAAELIYSFHVLVGKRRATWLSFGISGNVEQQKLDESSFTPQFDPLITRGTVREYSGNASSGIYLYNSRYYAGFAVYNLLPVNSDLGMGYGAERYYASFQGGCLLASRRSPIKLQSSFQGMVGSEIIQTDITNRFIFRNNFWAALTLRKYSGKFKSAGQNAIVFIGYDYNNWSFSYNYNIDINGTQFHHFGTHQISLGYKICPGKYSCPTYK